MSELFLYTVAASSDPNRVTCSVPNRIDNEEIFFGPCKKRLRELLRAKYLGPKQNSSKPDESIYLAAGRIKKIMTFEHAYKNLSGKKYLRMRNDEWSPLLVEPLYKNGKFQGYKHRSKLHAPNDGWISDLVGKSTVKDIQRVGNKILIKDKASCFETFKRDCCLILENIFFADGIGIEFDNKALKILGGVQPKRNIDSYAIFGYRRDGSADGKTGSYLSIKGSASQKFINWIKHKAAKRKLKGSHGNAFISTVCKSV
jgi:hypothetical protein